MPSAQPTGVIPQWDWTDRLVKSLRVAGMSTGDMARYLDKSTQTIRDWLASPAKVGVSYRRDWATRTGVDYGWLWLDNDSMRDVNAAHGDYIASDTNRASSVSGAENSAGGHPQKRGRGAT